MPRRRTDKLGPALDVELLLADLLARAEAGNLPLASDDEARAWESAWCRSNPGRFGADFEDMPLGVARRAAAVYLEVILPLIPRDLVRWRAYRLAAEAWAREHPGPPHADHGQDEEWRDWWTRRHVYLATHREAFDVIEEQAQIECAEEREYVIRKFKLADLVHVPAVAVAPVAPDELDEQDEKETP